MAAGGDLNTILCQDTEFFPGNTLVCHLLGPVAIRLLHEGDGFALEAALRFKRVQEERSRDKGPDLMMQNNLLQV